MEFYSCFKVLIYKMKLCNKMNSYCAVLAGTYCAVLTGTYCTVVY